MYCTESSRLEITLWLEEGDKASVTKRTGAFNLTRPITLFARKKQHLANQSDSNLLGSFKLNIGNGDQWCMFVKPTSDSNMSSANADFLQYSEKQYGKRISDNDFQYDFQVHVKVKVSLHPLTVFFSILCSLFFALKAH